MLHCLIAACAPAQLLGLTPNTSQASLDQLANLVCELLDVKCSRNGYGSLRARLRLPHQSEPRALFAELLLLLRNTSSRCYEAASPQYELSIPRGSL